MRRPFIYFGACYGLGGGIMAVMFLALILNAIEGPLQALLGSYQVPIVVRGFDGKFLLSMLIVGISLGVIGAWVAVRQRLHSAQFV
jgi:cell division transport system permease protein